MNVNLYGKNILGKLYLHKINNIIIKVKQTHYKELPNLINRKSVKS